MQGNKLFVFFILIVLLISSCKPKELKTAEYIKYIKSEKSKLYKTRIVGNYKFELLYLPIDYKIALQIKKGKGDTEQFKKLKNEMNQMQYFTLKISPVNSKKSILKYNLQTEEQYQARLAYFSFGMQKDIYIEQEDKKIKCDLYHFERAYDLSNFRIFNLAFEEKQENRNTEKTLVIHSDFFGTGPIKFKFKEKDLKGLPKLIIE